MTPNENLRMNVEWIMERRRLSQEVVAKRMRSIGFSWYRRTVNRFIRGERRLDFDELYGLALALETTVGNLQAPCLGSESVIDLIEASYRIGVLESISATDYEELGRRVAGPDDQLPRIRLDGWPKDPIEGPRPRWLGWLRGGVFEEIRGALHDGGWLDEAEFMHTHPETDQLQLGELVRFIRGHPK